MEQTANLDTRQFIVFKLDREEYGVDTQKITTIVRMSTITRVPKTPSYIKGVINLRGEIIPIMDLRTKFSLQEIGETEDTRIIIVKIDDILMGIIVDAVAEVVEFDEESVEQINSFNNDFTSDYLYGVGKLDGRIITLLNIDKLVKL